jgi:hypothetical protein
MATPQEKLAGSLEALKTLQDKGIIAIRAGNLSRTHRERLLKNGFIQEVMKGWYIAARPGERAGDSTGWYASFWDFCAAYLRTRFGKKTGAFHLTNHCRSTAEIWPFPHNSTSERPTAATTD